MIPRVIPRTILSLRMMDCKKSNNETRSEDDGGYHYRVRKLKITEKDRTTMTENKEGRRGNRSVKERITREK